MARPIESSWKYALCALLLLLPRLGLAQATSDAERAQQLFDAARTLMLDGKYSEACAKFAESEALDPGGGTILNLGLCRKAEGRTATAQQLLTEALARAREGNRADRIATAERALAELAPLLSRLTIVVDPGAQGAGLTLELDGAPLASELRLRTLILDPGAHRVVASRPGYEPWSSEITLGGNADAKTLTVPPLRASAPPAAAPAAPALAAPPARPSQKPSRPVAPREAAAGSAPRAAYALLAGGGLLLGGGAYFGARALSLQAKSDRYFDGKRCTRRSCVDDWNDAKASATLANIGIGVGVVAAGVGAYLLLRPAQKNADRRSLLLSVGPFGSGAGATASADF